MPEWKERPMMEVDGMAVLVKERVDQRNRHGASEYIITVLKDGEPIHMERHPWNVWVGHCSGTLLIPEIVQRAKSRLERQLVATASLPVAENGKGVVA